MANDERGKKIERFTKEIFEHLDAEDRQDVLESLQEALDGDD